MQTFTNLEFTWNVAASLVDNQLLLALKVSLVQLLMVLELLHGLTERDGVRTPDVPGRSTPHTPGLAGLHALQEVVVLLLLAGLLRPVEEVVLGDGDPTVLVVARPQRFLGLKVKQDPGENEAVGHDVVKLGVVDDDSVVEAGVEIEEEAVIGSVALS